MREVWRVIDGFPNYSVSNHGRVSNNRTGRILALLRNQWNVIHVGLVHDKVQYKRSLAKLVATYFSPDPAFSHCNTPTHLDGDRENNRSDNLVWRPDWFAAKYHDQFKHDRPLVDRKIMDIDTGLVYLNSWDVAQSHGLLETDIKRSMIRETSCWPTGQQFAEP